MIGAVLSQFASFERHLFGGVTFFSAYGGRFILRDK